MGVYNIILILVRILKFFIKFFCKDNYFLMYYSNFKLFIKMINFEFFWILRSETLIPGNCNFILPYALIRKIGVYDNNICI